MKIKDASGAIKKKGSTKEMTKGLKVLVCVGIIFIFAGICTLFTAANGTVVTVGVRFDDIFEGRNPDGSPFEISEVLSDAVLERAIAKLEMNVTAKDLRRHLTVSDLVDEKRVEKAKENISESRDEYSDFPTTYQIKYESISEQIKNEGIISSISVFFKHLGMPSKTKILETVGECAAEVYKEKYVIDSSSLDINWKGADAMDYYNRALYVRKTAGRISRLLQSEYENDTAFASKQTETGFGDLREKLLDIDEIHIENFQSFVVQNGITKDRSALLSQFKYMKEKNIEINERKTEEYKINKNAVEIYDPAVTKVVFIPSIDSDRDFYMNRTKVGVDYLIERADRAKKAADDAEHNVIMYDYLLGKFAEDRGASKEEFAKADALYEGIKTSMNTVVEEAKTVFEDHSSTEYEFLNFKKPECAMSFMGMIVYGGKLFVWLLLVAFVLVGIFTAAYKAVKKER